MPISIESLLQRLEPLSPIPTDTVARTPQLPGIRAVLFDIYGTLLVSSSGDVDVCTFVAEGVAECFELACCCVLAGDRLEFGRTVIDEYKRAIRSCHTVARAEGRPWPEVDIRQVWRDVVEILDARGAIERSPETDIDHLAIAFENRMNPVYPMPGMVDVLSRLDEAGILLGLISNAQFFTPMLLNHFLSAPPVEDSVAAPFDATLAVFSYRQLRAKPDPTLFEAALNTVHNRGLLAEDVLFVGNDMLNDIAGATRVGFKTALFAGDQRSLRLRTGMPQVRDVLPDCVVTELSQLLNVIGLEA